MAGRLPSAPFVAMRSLWQRAAVSAVLILAILRFAGVYSPG